MRQHSRLLKRQGSQRIDEACQPTPKSAEGKMLNLPQRILKKNEPLTKRN